MKYLYSLLLLLSGCATKTQPAVEDFSQYQIEVVAPSSGCDTEFLKDLPVKFNGFYNDDEKKTEVLKKALLNEKNDIVWALRGGYGSAKVVEILYDDKEFFDALRNKKENLTFIGYSDITALHLFLSQEFGWKTVHGPVFKEITDSSRKENFKIIKSFLSGIREIKFIGLKPLNESAMKTNKISGKLTGGNLSIIQTSIGTRWQIKTDNKILFLEDCNEKPYEVDRLLNHLLSAKILDQVKGIIIGSLCNDSNDMKKTIMDFGKKLSIPIYSLDVFGHGIYNYPMIYNSDVEILSEDGVKILKEYNL